MFSPPLSVTGGPDGKEQIVAIFCVEYETASHTAIGFRITSTTILYAVIFIYIFNAFHCFSSTVTIKNSVGELSVGSISKVFVILYGGYPDVSFGIIVVADHIFDLGIGEADRSSNFSALLGCYIGPFLSITSCESKSVIPTGT